MILIRWPLLGLILVFVMPLASAIGQSIERPAGQLIQPHPRADISVQHEASKSKLVPILRKTDVAKSKIKAAPIAGGAASQGTSLSKMSSDSKPRRKSPDFSAASIKPVKRVVSKLASSENPLAHQRNSAGVTADGGGLEGLNDDPWDSASKRFDQNDPSLAVSQGVRVEDIIEPTSEYKYSGSRKKNPFIPQVVIGRAGQQKDLNPNDVEIPIINPLQSFAVNQLSVIGVWEGDDGVWKALIQTPTNQGIETKLGDPAGNSGGRIMTITPDSVVVREFSVRADGTREYRDKPLYMGSDKPQGDSSSIGGRVILRPGSTTPEIESPNGSGNQPLGDLNLVPGSQPGTMKTVIPGSELKVPDQLNSNAVSPSSPISMPAGVPPQGMYEYEGGAN